MARLTKETIDYLLQPGVLFREDGTFVSFNPLVGEERENANAAYRVGFLHEDIDAVLEEINTKRGFTSEDEADSDDNDANHRSDSSNLDLSLSLSDIFGVDTVLHKVEIDYHGITIRIGSVTL